jgi:hypothetical protein
MAGVADLDSELLVPRDLPKICEYITIIDIANDHKAVVKKRLGGGEPREATTIASGGGRIIIFLSSKTLPQNNETGGSWWGTNNETGSKSVEGLSKTKRARGGCCGG